MELKPSELIASIKKLGWSKIKLTRRGYRGAIQTYKTSRNSLVPIMFYIDEAFIVEDSEGLFGVQDLEYGLMNEKSIDLEGTGHIEGLSLVAFIEDGEIYFNDKVLDRLDINSELIRSDIERRLKAVNVLGEMEEVDMGFGSPGQSI